MWTIPARVRGFTGRTELLAELEAALRSSGSTVVQAVRCPELLGLEIH